MGNVSVLLIQAACHTCALTLAHVVEVMRPLAVEPVAGAPAMVRGLSVIRGAPVPVVALQALFGTNGGSPTRLVVVRVGDRRVALAVDEVVGIRQFPLSVLSAMPPVVRDAGGGALEAIGAMDSQLMYLLNTARIVPEELLRSLSGEER